MCCEESLSCAILACEHALFMLLQLVTVRQVAGVEKGKYDQENYYMCGDTCTHKEFPCLCGNSTLTFWHTQHYCCLPPGERCSDGNRKTVCRSGEAVHKSEPLEFATRIVKPVLRVPVGLWVHGPVSL